MNNKCAQDLEPEIIIKENTAETTLSYLNTVEMPQLTLSLEYKQKLVNPDYIGDADRGLSGHVICASTSQTISCNQRERI